MADPPSPRCPSPAAVEWSDGTALRRLGRLRLRQGRHHPGLTTTDSGRPRRRSGRRPLTGCRSAGSGCRSASAEPPRWDHGARAEERPESRGDLVDVVGSDGDGDDELVDVSSATAGDVDAVELEEHGGGQPAEAFVAVDQRVVLQNRVEERSGLRPEVGVGVLAEQRGLRTCRGGASSPASRIGGGSPSRSARRGRRAPVSVGSRRSSSYNAVMKSATSAIEVGVRELKNNLSRYLDRVEQGEEVLVTDGAARGQARRARAERFEPQRAGGAAWWSPRPRRPGAARRPESSRRGRSAIWSTNSGGDHLRRHVDPAQAGDRRTRLGAGRGDLGCVPGGRLLGARRGGGTRRAGRGPSTGPPRRPPARRRPTGCHRPRRPAPPRRGHPDPRRRRGRSRRTGSPQGVRRRAPSRPASPSVPSCSARPTSISRRPPAGARSTSPTRSATEPAAPRTPTVGTPRFRGRPWGPCIRRGRCP